MPELTEQERKLIRLIAEEKGSKNEAEAIGLSESGFKALLKRVREKLQTTGRVGIVRWGIRNGIVEP
jgi:DNA-binding CsgD family transcriptional regulator